MTSPARNLSMPPAGTDVSRLRLIPQAKARAGLRRLLRGSSCACLFLLALALSGCVTKSKAAAQARAAYIAGQQEAIARLRQQAEQQPQPQRQQTQPLNVTIYGDVQNPIIPWKPGLTLAAAILAAGFPGSANPTAIHIMRNGVAMAVDPKELANGADVPLQPGDLVQIK